MAHIVGRLDSLVTDEIRHLLATVEKLIADRQSLLVALAPPIVAMYEELDRLSAEDEPQGP